MAQQTPSSAGQPQQPTAKPEAGQPQQAVISQRTPAIDLGAVSLAQLLDSIVALKKSGLLGLLSYLAERADESFLAAATDPALMRLMAVLAALQQGLIRVDSDDLSRAQNNIGDLTGCAFKALGGLDVSEERRLGPLGAADRLMDPDVQTALWVLLEVAKALGRCLREGGRG